MSSITEQHRCKESPEAPVAGHRLMSLCMTQSTLRAPSVVALSFVCDCSRSNTMIDLEICRMQCSGDALLQFFGFGGVH